MGNAAVNIVVTPNALPAAKQLKERFGTPYYNLVNPNDPESLTEEALLSI
jgi:nitrogenase molybdenum-iron protein alpha/beta subunit